VAVPFCFPGVHRGSTERRSPTLHWSAPSPPAFTSLNKGGPVDPALDTMNFTRAHLHAGHDRTAKSPAHTPTTPRNCDTKSQNTRPQPGAAVQRACRKLAFCLS